MAAAEPELGWSVQTEDQVQQHLLVHRTTSQARKLPTIYIYIYIWHMICGNQQAEEREV